MRGSEIGAVATEDLDPLLLGVLGGLGDQVGGVGFAAACHGDVRRGGSGSLADEDVAVVDGVALCAVDGGGVGEFDEPCRVLGRYFSIPPVAVQEEAAVLPDADHRPGLPVCDLEVAVVASGGDAITEPDWFAGVSGDDFAASSLVVISAVVADGGVEVGAGVAFGDRCRSDRAVRAAARRRQTAD